MIDYNCPQYDYIPLLQMLRKSLSTSLLAPPFFMIPRERPNVKAIVIRMLYKPNSLGKLQKKNLKNYGDWHGIWPV
jgi:hypothetical protein